MGDSGGRAKAAAGDRRRLMGPGVMVWDWPLRLWHWAFAAFIGVSLYTGLDGDIGLLDWHQRSGMVLLGLLVFRLGWGLWGGTYARLGHYWTTPAAFIGHFRGRRWGRLAHTAPGVMLAVVLVVAAMIQVGTGLMTSDDVFNEGPLHRHVSRELAGAASWIHHRLYWLILAAVATHLAAHAVYGLWLRDPTPLAMFTGRKPAVAGAVGKPQPRRLWLRAALTLAMAVAVVLAVNYSDRLLG